MSVSLQGYGVVVGLDPLPTASLGRLNGYGLYLKLESIDLLEKWDYRTAIITGNDIEILPRRAHMEEAQDLNTSCFPL
jgi:hypothetical protein